MRRGVWAALSVTALISAAFVIGTATGLSMGHRSPVARKVSEIDRLIRSRHPDDIPPEKLERETVAGMLRAVDPYSEFFTAEEWVEWQQRHMSGRFFGVGIHVEPDRDSGYILITTPIEDSPAFEADILPGDLIVAVDGEDIQGRLMNDVVRRIKGEKGTKVVLTIHRKGRPRFDVALTRAEIKIQAVHHRMADPQAGVGYIRVSDFTEMLPEFDKAAAALQGQGLKALVIDLRFNGGGLLQAAVDLCDRFLPAGHKVATSEGRTSADRRVYETRDNQDLPATMPIVVLTNGYTASASEIFAGAIRDHGRGVLAGARTYGKGTVQTPFDLSDGSHLKLTTARWYTPAGHHVSAREGSPEHGLLPDFVVEMTRDEEAALLKQWATERIKKGLRPEVPVVRDYPLEAALEILRAKLEVRAPSVQPREVAKLPGTDPK
jgi:carboxyl-terminal processing protease